jgi:hypothetical protein
MTARARDVQPPVRWVPVSQLSPLARALLSDDLGGRDVVPERVADRVTGLATEWAASGFTTDTVRPWVDLPPATARSLASGGVDPAALDLPVRISPTTAPVTLRQALVAGLLSPDQVHDRLAPGVRGRGKRPAPAAPPVTNPTATPAATPSDTPAAQPETPAAPALFSHPVDELDHGDRSRRPKPSQSPFSA